MARFPRRGGGRPRPVPGPVPAGPPHGAGARPGRRRPRHGHHRLHQHGPARPGAVVPRRRGARATDPGRDPVERDGDGRPRQRPLRGSRRPPVDVRLGGRALRRRLQPLLEGQERRRLRRPDLHPGPRRARHLRRARSSRGGCPRSSSTGSGARSAVGGCRAIRTRGVCPTSGSSPPCRWASAR